MTASLNAARAPWFKTAGAALLLVIAALMTLIWFQFRGDFTRKTQLTLLAARAGLVMDRGAKVTYNGVEIGRVADVVAVDRDGQSKAQITLEVGPQFLMLMPANVIADIKATTVFGNKYIAFTAPENPVKQRVSSEEVIDVSSVTTEFNTVFATIVSISEKVDPIKLNQTLTAAAQALDGLGARFGQSLDGASAILDDLNPQMPQLRYDTRRLTELGDIYANASPDLWNSLTNAVTTARTVNEQQGNLDAALLASIGISNTGADILERGGPYLIRGAEDLVPTTGLLDEYSPEILCTIRNYADVAPRVYKVLGGNNGYSLRSAGTVTFSGNPYIYPDNLPRVNAHGGPEGRPGCWQNITHDLWPAPYLVMDTGYSMAPYNHFGLAQPITTDYVWGRQFGELSINP